MAGLNLTPNPTIIAIQLGIFLTAYYSVKNLVLTPYLELRKKREIATSGRKDDALGLLGENETITSQIDQKLATATRSMRDEHAIVRRQANETKAAIIGAADAEARSELKQVQERIRAELAEQRAKLPQVIEQLSAELYAKTIH